jgi:hypothetical protein
MLGNGTPKSSSNTGAIAGGSVGGVSIISLVIAIGFFLRRRRRRASAPITPPVVGAYQPPMDGSRQALTMHDGYTASSLTGTIGSSSMPGTPLVPMTNVRVSWSSNAVSCPFFFFLTLRTQIIYLRSLGTKEFRRHRPRLFKKPYRRSLAMDPGTPWPLCRPHGNRVITTAWLLSDFAL